MTVVLLLWLFAPHIGIQPIDKEKTQQQAAVNSNQPKGKAEPSNSIPSSQSASDKKPANNQTLPDHQTWDWHKAIAPEYLSNWALVFVGLGAVIAALLTLYAIKKQSDTMNAQMKSLAGKERPRIGIKLDDPTFDEDVSIVLVTIDCWCPTAAFVIRAEGEAYVDRGGGIPRLPSYLPLPLFNQIYSTNQVQGHFPVFSGAHPARIDVQLIRSQQLFLHCHGIIEYRGVHLTDKDPPYRTTFSKRWIAEEIPIIGMGEGYWEDWPDAEANQQT